jgi:hypothetical protein
MKNQNQEKVLSSTLRDTLKKIIKKELDELPKNLESLNPKDRIELLCKIFPFALPKIESVSYGGDAVPAEYFGFEE